MTTAPTDGGQLLDIPETARRLQLSRHKVYAMAQQGEIPVIRIGRSVRVPADALAEWIRQRTEGTGR